nr:Ulp1 family isopeptidase [Wolbachia endosymbiont (group A) of Hylaeus communis]
MSNGDGLIRSLVDGDLEGFRQGFESFLDQCPSFLYHVSTGRFLPVFFFSMFATAHDANILNANERVYFCFDNHGVNPRNGENRNTANLKVAVYRDGQQVVRCYSISDRPNSDGLRFSTRERNALVQEIRRQNPNLREEDLDFEQYKVCTHGKGKSQGEAIATVFEVIRAKDRQGRDKFAKYSASEINLIRLLLEDHRLTIKEIAGRQLSQNQRRQLGNLVNFAQVAQGQQGIDNFMEMLASDRRQDVRDRMYEEIVPYIARIYHNYRQELEYNIENRIQKFESHGFLLGFLANFSHRYTIGIELDLSPRNSHVAFFVRHQAEKAQVIETFKSIRIGGTPTAQVILQQINAILRRNNAREIEDVHDLLALDFATDNQNDRYWLQTHDMFFAAQQYTFYDDRSNPTNNRHDFTITSVGVDGNQNDPTGRGLLSSHIANFKQKVDSGEKDRLIAIINVGNHHWVTLVIVHQNGNYYGYYADSLAPDSRIDNNIRGALRECDINDGNVHNVSVHQQTDGHNCGIWVYENARDINQAIDQALQGNNNFGEKGEGIIGYIRGLLSVGIGNDTRQSQRNEQHFKNRRRNISQLFQNDPLSSPRGRLIQDHPGIQHEIDPLLLQFLGLQYPQRGGGGALQLGGERVISIDLGNPQSALDKIDGVSRVYNHSNSRGSR